MCGIAGFFTLDQAASEHENRVLVKDMCMAIAHRGPDAQGIWCAPQDGIYLGHRRLSILDLSAAGAQPMASHSGRYQIVFNGEIYNAPALLKTLQEIMPNLALRGHSDTEILLESFSILGIEKTLARIKGMFAIALWDAKDKKLHLMRDHLGKKPLYVGWVDNKIAFASELKALRAMKAHSFEIDQAAFQAYRYFGFIPAPQSIYKGIFKLPPAHCVTLEAKDLKDKRADVFIRKSCKYWVLQKRTSVLSPEDLRVQLKELLLEAVSARMMADVPLGAFLSGGVDSSLVSAMMQAQSARNIKTYSIGFENSDFDESRHAEKIAQHLKTDHTTYRVSAADCLNVIPHLPHIYDEPFADYSQIPSIVLCQQARKDTIVALSGDGGDEVFCGYKRYFMLKRLLDKTDFLPRTCRGALAGLLEALPQPVYNRLGVNGKRMHSIAGFLREPAFESAVLRTLSMNPSIAQPQGLALGQGEGLEDLERMMMIDTHLYLPDDILVKVDRASMAASMEVRSPLLDKDLIEFAWHMPLSEKVFSDGGRGKKPLYDLLCTYVPKELVDRPKQGFTPPVAAWLRAELRDWAQDLIETRTPLFDSAEIKVMWDEFLSGKADHHNALWSILMAQAWYSRYS